MSQPMILKSVEEETSIMVKTPRNFIRPNAKTLAFKWGVTKNLFNAEVSDRTKYWNGGLSIETAFIYI